MARGLRLAASVVVLAVVVSGAGGRATAGVRHAAVAPVPQASVVIPGKLIVGFRRGVSARDRQQALDAAGAGTGRAHTCVNSAVRPASALGAKVPASRTRPSLNNDAVCCARDTRIRPASTKPWPGT